MRNRIALAALVLAFVVAALAGWGCYATTSTPVGPNCVVDPGNPACVTPIHDKKNPDGGTP